MSISQIKLLGVHLTGYFHVFMHVVVASMLVGWGLQFLAMLHAEVYDWTGVFVHLVLSLSFLAFFPGQTVWTYRLLDRDGVEHTIVGRTPDQDMQHD